ncbi:hypothetical protein [Bradyrhizobium sp. McL0616]|uniref:hypothetical protein n=1 Tax=Bradyrhizobium sp. McL0616 TaxID=3415674 RepID=UPI003CF1FAE9
MNAAYGLHPWKPYDITGTFYSPLSPDLAGDFARLQLEFDDRRAVALVDQQGRLRPQDVGGFVQLTTVREFGIETRILKRWKEGERPARPRKFARDSVQAVHAISQ